MPTAVRRLSVDVLARAALVLAALAIATAASAALDFPALSGRVVDEAGLLSAAERTSLTETLAAEEAKSGRQIVVVTLKSLRGTTIEDYGYQLGRAWGIGEKGKDNGALLIVAPNERKVRIEVGYGLEPVLTDAASRIIIERVILPSFRSGEFGPGIVAGVGAILNVVSGEDVAEASQRSVEERRDEAFPVGLFFMLLIAVFFLMAMSRRSRRVLPGGYYGGLPPSGGGWGGGGGGGGSDWGGGGGSFGGGGASGDW